MPWNRCAGVVAACLAIVLLAPAVQAEPKSSPFREADRQYWAFQPVERAAVPANGQIHPVDAFVAEKLTAKGLTLGPPVDKATLLRRVSFDLIGLPPTPEDVQAFLADDSPDAFARVVDRLLASPQYGERWGRHWLDLARYAESNGFKSDETRPNAWRYRDYVIRSFNDDKPYDRFVAEQIAGDELWPDDLEARAGTGFHRNYPDESNAANMEQRRAEILLDVTDAVGATFLGLTVGCAKCHDHKFDPILQKDYYRLQSFFAATAEDDFPLLPPAELAEYRRRLAEWQDATRSIREEMEAIYGPVRDAERARQVSRYPEDVQRMLAKAPEERTPFERQMSSKHEWQMSYALSPDVIGKRIKGEARQRYDALQAELAQYDDLHPGELPVGFGVRDLGGAAPKTHVLSLANYAAPKDEVAPGFLSILDEGAAAFQPLPELKSTGRRAALARWIASEENPLTARVMVNRLWHYHFGRGIVATPSDFGRMGERPSHPELLDWLAAEFVDQGWSLKQMHRLILTSKTYQQASDYRPAAAEKDPFNKLLWRYEPRRLEGEVIRDSMLRVSGLLSEEVGGPSVFPPLPSGMPTPRGGWDATEELADQTRRSVYVFVRRNARYPLLESFDMPDTHETCARRVVTTTAPQALALLNDEQSLDWAEGFAGRLLARVGDDAGRQVEEGYLLAYSRKPDPTEKDAAQTFLEKQRLLLEERAAAGEPLALPAAFDRAEERARAAALVDFCHALLNSNEFVYAF